VEGGEFFFACAAEAAHELEETPGIGGDDGVGLRGQEMRDFTVAELLRWLGLEEIVDARGTAAERGFGDFSDLEVGDGGE